MDASRSPSRLGFVEECRDQFEAAWNTRPRIADFLQRSPADKRAPLLRELLRIDLQYRRQRGETPVIGDYLPELSDDIPAVESVFAAAAPATGHSSSLISTIAAESAGANGPNENDTLPGWSAARFRITKAHARGGLGEVSKALDRELNREVALKEIQARYSSDRSARQRFALEAEVTGQLEHPGIVPIYSLGAYQDGRPFYAMRFIQGRSLQEAIRMYHEQHKAGADGHVELRQLLGRFVQVCHAVAFAHSRGVIHRDIKPANIMLGEFGETLLVDWGLAKRFINQPGKSDDSPSALAQSPSDITDSLNLADSAAPAANGDADLTQPGQWLGTRGYMSPEQAAGDMNQMGPACDIFSLGATLYHILVGRPPYNSRDVAALREQIKAAQFEPPRNVDGQIPKALEAICLRAMNRHPADRYATAQDLANEIERYLADEPVTAWREPILARARRWTRKHQALVSTAAAALILTVIGAVLVAWQQKVHSQTLEKKNGELLAQREKAESREEMAIEAVKRFRDAVAENPELKGNPSLDRLRKTLLKEPLAFFRKLCDELQADEDTGTESLERLGVAAFELGNLSDEIGDYQDALRAFGQSREIHERLVLENPDVSQFQSNLALCLENTGILLRQTGKPVEALAAHDAALAIQRKLAADHPTVTQFQSELAHSHNSIGVLLRATGKPVEALAAFEAALAIRRRLADDNPTVTELQRELASSHNNIGVLLRDTGKPVQALASYEAALAIRRKLAADNPTVTEFQSDLARSHNNIGVLLRQTGKPVEALAVYEEALVIRQTLAADNPTDTQFQNDLAESHYNIGFLLGAMGKHVKALSAYESALAIRQKLAADNPTVTQFQSDLAESHNNIGILLGATGKPVEALAAYESALAIRRKLAADNPTVTEFQSDLAGSHNNIGVLLSATGKPVEALAEYQAALAIQEKLAADNPTVTQLQSELASSHNNIGVVLRATGKPVEALVAFEAALAIQEKLAAENPTVTELQSDLSASHENIGILLHQSRKPVESLVAHEAALVIRQKLARENPDSPDFASELGGTLNNLASLDLESRRFAEARDRLREAIIWQKKALGKFPNHSTYRQYLSNHYNLLNLAAQGLADRALAEEARHGLAELEASDPALIALDKRLSEVLGSGEVKDNPERLALAQRAYNTRRFAFAASLWGQALESDPALLADRQAQHAYNAACAAALAGCGQGIDDPMPDDAAKAQLRGQALTWLNGELDIWNKLLETATPEVKQATAETLAHWQEDPDLSGIRGEAIDMLPEPEREACRALWKRVQELLDKSRQADKAP